MEFKPLFNPVEKILEDYEYFMTAYQIGLEIKRNYPALWQQIINEYGSDVGNGSGQEFSWANYISLALEYCLANNKILGLQKEFIATEGIKVRGITPGNEYVAIWRKKP